MQNYNFSKYVHDFNKLVQGFTKEKYLKLKEQSKKFTQADVVPVFICGLPRSGSTLIESVLTAHEEVAGVGEINDFKENFIHVLGDLSVHPSGYVLDWNLIDEEKLLVLRERYLKLLKAKNARVNKDGKGKFLINKMLTNFQYFPLIKLMFPEAIIIHAQRHPIDMLWSCFKIFFDGDDKYIYNLDELAAHYNIYRELTDHWHSFMGDDVICINHEQLTKTPKAEIERLLNYCGLEWSDKCLNFHQELKTVKTASFEQVRKPIQQKEKLILYLKLRMGKLQRASNLIGTDFISRFIPIFNRSRRPSTDQARFKLTIYPFCIFNKLHLTYHRVNLYHF